jgi:hypothetical protein
MWVKAIVANDAGGKTVIISDNALPCDRSDDWKIKTLSESGDCFSGARSICATTGNDDRPLCAKNRGYSGFQVNLLRPHTVRRSLAAMFLDVEGYSFFRYALVEEILREGQDNRTWPSTCCLSEGTAHDLWQLSDTV